MPSQETFCLAVSGEFACFTRPEMKVERVSYDVITPSAARAVFEAVLWKPAMCWQITKIEVLNPIRWINVRRNEVAAIASKDKENIIVEHTRQQRAGLLLRDVSYRLHACFHLRDDSKHVHNFPELMRESTVNENSYPKFAEMFKRRARNGQCFNQPYLGTREFSANFRLVDTEQLEQEPPPIDESRDLGWMLYDLDFVEPTNPIPMFFQANLQQGRITVPLRDSPEVRR